MRRLLLPLLLSGVGTILLFMGAAMAGGICHCMTAMYQLFPYGTFVTMKMGWDSFGLLLSLLQFPLYVLIVIGVKGARWRVLVLLLILTLHVAAASLGLRDYCLLRHRCSVVPSRSGTMTAERLTLNKKNSI